MATGTVYLDVDDEITSAAARIRKSEATKVALVVPYGSRIATSRMNFRLLSREALVNNRRLSIVSADAATRALAASAGLPVFASVAEWDEAAPVAGADAEPLPAQAQAAEAVVRPITTSRSRKKATGPSPDATQTLGLPIAADAAAGSAAAVGAASAAGSAGSAPAASAAGPASSTIPSSGIDRPLVVPRSAPASVRMPVVKNRSLPRVGGLAMASAAMLVLVLVVAAVGAYVFLPSAEIVVTPREEPMSISLVVRADPDVAAPDATANLVPALLLDVPVEVSDAFAASDKRIEEEAAGGQVEFSSLNTASENTIAKGAVVSTEGGIKFKTTAAITLARAQIIPPTEIRPSTKTVGVVAVKPGTGGNVPQNAITVVPPNEDPTVTKVRNLAPTSGGTHEEFPRIGQKDVDAALVALTAKLADAFATELESGAGGPVNATVFSETAVLGEATPTVDPATLVGKEQESFELTLAATGTVTAVDASPVVKIAETRLLANVGTDHRLVEGSIEIVPGDPTVANGEVTFPVAAKASRVRILDPAGLLNLVKGQPLDKARTLLAEFGDAVVTPWPDWVSAIPTMDSRVTIEIVGQTDVAGEESPQPSGSETASPTSRPPATSSPSDTASPAAPAASPAP